MNKMNVKTKKQRIEWEREELIYVLDFYFQHFEIISGNAGSNSQFLEEDNKNIIDVSNTLKEMHIQSGRNIPNDYSFRSASSIVKRLLNYLYCDPREKKSNGLEGGGDHAKKIFNEYYDNQFDCKFKASGIEDEVKMEMFSFESDENSTKTTKENSKEKSESSSTTDNNTNGGEIIYMSDVKHSELEKQEEYLEKHPEFLKQKEYIDEQEKSGDLSQLDSPVIADAFVRGVRDLGYKSAATAANELIDNSFQSGSSVVALDFLTYKNKVNEIFIIDNGHGMIPGMLRAAARWGGTHREGDRSGFGRYGYGLPSASVSQGKKFTVYSKAAIEGSKWHKITVDLSILDEGGKASDLIGNVEEAVLPEFLDGYVVKNSDGEEIMNISDMSSGTIVHWDKLDKLKWKNPNDFESNMMTNIGTTYWRFLSNRSVYLMGKRVQGLDPLFVTPGLRGYEDPNGVKAEEIKHEDIEMKTDDSKDLIRVRFSFIPPTFAHDNGKTNQKSLRWKTLSANRGLIISRNGRLIDVISNLRGKNKLDYNLQNYDQWWKCEIDFPATLDEDFSVTTSKQQITMSDRVWEALRNRGVRKTMRNGYQLAEKRFSELREAEEIDPNKPRPSEEIAAEVKKLTEKPTDELVTRRKRAEDNKKIKIEARVREKNISEEEAQKEVSFEFSGRFKISQEDIPNGPFFRVEDVGGCLTIMLNRDHLFYKNVYHGKDSTPKMRQALDLLLFTIGDTWENQSDDARMFYQSQVNEWSQYLNMQYEKLASTSGFEETEDQ